MWVATLLIAACGGGSTSRQSLDATPSADPDAALPEPDAAPQWEPWSLQLVGPWQDQVQFAEAADDGSVLLAGEVLESAILGSEEMTSEGPSNAFFLARVGPGGNVTWADVYGGFEETDAVFVTDMAIDPSSGDLFVTGRFMGTIDFGGSEPAAAVGDTFDFYVARYSGADGSLVWANDYGGPAWDAGTALGVTPEGDVVTAGYVDGYVQVGGEFLGPTTLRDVFLARYAGADGAHVWSGLLPGPVAEEITSLDVGDGGEIVAGGLFWAENPGPEGPPPALLAWFEPDGDLAGETEVGTGQVRVYATAAAADGDAVVAGTFHGDVTIGDMDAHADTTHAFFARADAAARNIAWATTAGDEGSAILIELAVGPGSRVVGVGYLQGNAPFGDDVPDSSGGQAALLLEVDIATGQALGGTAFGSVQARANAVTARPDGGLVLVGSFQDDIDLGSGILTADVPGDGFAALLPP
jgi:hypothetical protein